MKEINRDPNIIQSTNFINKHMVPPLPPKKINNLPPNLPKPVSNHTPSLSSYQPVVNSPSGNIFKKELSYA